MAIEYRPITEHEYPAFLKAEARGFLRHITDEEAADSDRRKRFELDRGLAAFDGPTVVGTTGAYSLHLTVPPDVPVPTGGVTDVTVQPTHRRRGILTGLMRRQLEDFHERGEPLGALWTSETPIYGRFGYGMAFQHAYWKIDRRHTAYARPLTHSGRLAFVEPDEARRIAPAVWDRARLQRPGMISRPDSFWDDRFRDPPERRGGSSAYFCAVYEDDGRTDGYVLYRVRDRWEEEFPAATLSVSELVTATDDAHAALWRLCLDVDLVGTIEVRRRPIDDPLPWLLADPRRLRPSLIDAVWLRIVDVTSALEARRYAHSGRLILEVRDSFCPWNNGRYELEGGPDDARCRPTREEPDIILDASELGSLYLGAVHSSTLAAAGRLEARTGEALRTTGDMFGWHIAPWCPEEF